MPDNEISLRELIQKIKNWFTFIRSKWVYLLIAIVLGAGLGFLYAKLKKPVYTATATFVLEDGGGGGGLGQYAGIASMVGLDLGGGGGSGIFSGDNILELYKSRTMITNPLVIKPDARI